MHVLCVYPPCPRTYWSADYALRMTGRRAVLPPLGLITVAALVPAHWDVRLCDMNVSRLQPADLRWADVVFISGMLIQREAILEVAAQVRALGKVVVVGGPDATTSPQIYDEHADAVVIGEAEALIAPLCAAIESRASTPLPHRWKADERPALSECPIPRYDLLEPGAYVSMAVQWSRGCPFTCEFCDIIEVFGRLPRTKSTEQFLRELEAVEKTGFRGSLFVVDDNFVGNKAEARRLLPVLADWMRERGYPFELYTEASVNLAADVELIDLMVASGFNSVFLGIETTDVTALRNAQKLQNTRLCLNTAVETLVSRGLEVMGGFIIGFDSDDRESIEKQRRWVLDSTIPMAMVGMLLALPGTQLTRRLTREGRMLPGGRGNNFVGSNFVTVMGEQQQLEGFTRLLAEVYEPSAYFDRAFRLVTNRFRPKSGHRLGWRYGLGCLLRSLLHQGILGSYRGAYWRFLRRAFFSRPRSFPHAVTLAIKGDHMIRYTAEDVLPKLRERLEALRASVGNEPAAAAG